MLKLGQFNTLVVRKTVEFGVYLAEDEHSRQTVLLPKKFIRQPLEIGTSLEVFLYLDSEDRIVATTQRPLAQVGDLAQLRVKDINRIGAFLDWGLDKDLLVPFREQPERMLPGKTYMVYIYIDEVTKRIVASRRLHHFFDGDVTELKLNQKVKLLVWEPARLGWRVIVDRRYIGLIYSNELCQPLSRGQEMEGFVHNIRPETNQLDIRLRADGIEGVRDLKPAVLDALADAGGYLPVSGKSDATKIQEYFSFSKRVFKQVIGMLYKEGKITIEEHGIRLKEKKTCEKKG